MRLDKTFIRNLKKWRKAAGISQEKLAELCHASYSYIRQIECGSRTPSFSFIEKLADTLNIAPYLLFYDEDAENFPSSEKLSAAETELLDAVSGDIRALFAKLKA